MNIHAISGEPQPAAARPVLLLITSSRQLITQISAVTRPLPVSLTVTGSVRKAAHLMHGSALVIVGADKLPTLEPPPPPSIRARLLVVTADAGADLPGILALADDIFSSVYVCWLPAATAWLTEQITAALAPATGPHAAHLADICPTTQEDSQ